MVGQQPCSVSFERLQSKVCVDTHYAGEIAKEECCGPDDRAERTWQGILMLHWKCSGLTTPLLPFHLRTYCVHTPLGLPSCGDGSTRGSNLRKRKDKMWIHPS